ncbi:MAG TPA: hypothetical protein VK192_04825 [Sphingomicrobium sp.]|jgi:hypothetical protein|nr:hypothetical protein [Sphingomicrobium sp.]
MLSQAIPAPEILPGLQEENPNPVVPTLVPMMVTLSSGKQSASWSAE